MQVKVDEKLVREIGQILKLEFTDAQMSTIVAEINNTVSMFEELSQLDTEGVEGTFYGRVDQKASFRDDEPVRDEKEVEAILENTPETENNLIQVPAILDDGEGGA
ncbi:MAG TPA: Asp-tRNA(Asn)/Glu-tRNA(Gln) amidotransferase subunit GatC [Atopostipes sp.]|nr:Asp-tRNA(Asn)/Glu-tRNA(Gln) amidotransferase subunit GatC [Atopostipes sp.]